MNHEASGGNFHPNSKRYTDPSGLLASIARNTVKVFSFYLARASHRAEHSRVRPTAGLRILFSLQAPHELTADSSRGSPRFDVKGGP